jgi:phosphoglycerate dehydrogenase-like enzyme
MAPSAPRIAVAPSGTRDYLTKAVEDGGAELVDPDKAEALVWADNGRPEALTELLGANPGIRWVQLPWAGIEPFTDANVVDGDHEWTSGKGVYAEPVAEHALALALAGMREIKRYARANSWSDEAGISLVGGKATIFGGGGVGQALLRLLEPFGCEVTVIRNRPQPMEGARDVIGFDRRYEALKGADVVFLAHALTPATAGTIGAVELELMEPHSWLVNVGRGRHVVTEDLLVALAGDVIGGAALDVTDPEPLPDGHPLWELPNCLITPHVANTEAMGQALLSRRITENVRRFADGRPLLGAVDPDLGY